MSDAITFQQLILRLREGDESAAEQIYQRFSDRVIRVAHSNLSQLLRRKVDPDDVALSALGTAIRRLQDGRLEAQDWDMLWRLLFRITVNKCRKQADWFMAQRRDCRREMSLVATEDSAVQDWEPAAEEPLPLESVLLLEAVQDLLASFDNPQHQQIVQLRLQGHSLGEISVQVGLCERTVQRVLNRVQERLQERLQTP